MSHERKYGQFFLSILRPVNQLVTCHKNKMQKIVCVLQQSLVSPADLLLLRSPAITSDPNYIIILSIVFAFKTNSLFLPLKLTGLNVGQS